jgi:hypothetical protein
MWGIVIGVGADFRNCKLVLNWWVVRRKTPTSPFLLENYF